MFLSWLSAQLERRRRQVQKALRYGRGSQGRSRGSQGSRQRYVSRGRCVAAQGSQLPRVRQAGRPWRSSSACNSGKSRLRTTSSSASSMRTRGRKAPCPGASSPGCHRFRRETAVPQSARSASPAFGQTRSSCCCRARTRSTRSVSRNGSCSARTRVRSAPCPSSLAGAVCSVCPRVSSTRLQADATQNHIIERFKSERSALLELRFFA